MGAAEERDAIERARAAGEELKDLIRHLKDKDRPKGGPRRRLYDLETEYAEIMDMIDAADGEITDEIEARLSTLDGDLVTLVDALACMAREREWDAEMYAAEAKRQAERAQRAKHGAARIRDAIGRAMDRFGKTQVKGARFSVARVETAPAVVIDDEGRIPPEFFRQSVSVDKTALKKALSEGQEVPGVRLERGKTVRVA